MEHVHPDVSILSGFLVDCESDAPYEVPPEIADIENAFCPLVYVVFSYLQFDYAPFSSFGDGEASPDNVVVAGAVVKFD